MQLRLWLAAVLALIALTAWACGGGDDDDNGDTPGANNTSNQLPDEFPDDFPVYPDADFQNSQQGEQEGVSGIVATWQTGDDFDDVKAFYDDEFDDGPWTSTGDGTIAGSAFWAVEHSDSDDEGYVQVVAAGDTTTILAVVGEAAGGLSGDLETPDAGDDDPTPDGGDAGDSELPPETDLPDDYPSDDVPLPDGIRITNAASVTAGDLTTFAVDFYSQDGADDLAQHFEDELTDNGWTQIVESDTNDALFSSYTKGADGAEGTVTISIAESDIAGYNIVSLALATP